MAQDIYTILISELKMTTSHWVSHVMFTMNGSDHVMQTPLECLISGVEDKVQFELKDLERTFLTRVFAEVFHTGDIPKNRNHIAMSCDLTMRNRPTSSFLKFWIDLDKLAELTNQYFEINPNYRFTVGYGSSNQQTRADGWMVNASYCVNSVYNFNEINTNFLIGCITAGAISGHALVLAALAVTSLVSLSTLGIFTAVGVGVVAGIASYGFFKSQYKNLTTNGVPVESAPENIVEIFEQHFGDILSKNSFEVINEQPLSIS